MRKRGKTQLKYPPMEPFTQKELIEALISESHPHHKAAIMAASRDKEYEVPLIIWRRARQ